MLNVHRLRLLRELQLRGTVTAVAEALTYSPSAISQQLSQLERDVGVTLLEPVGRRLRLTSAGEVLCDHAAAVLRQLEIAQADLERSKGHVTGTLRAATFQSATLRLAPRLLTLLAERHPDLRIVLSEIDPDDALSALAARDFDLVVGEEYAGGPLPRSPELHRADLTRDPMSVVTAPGRPGGGSLLECASAPWVMEPVGNAARAWAEATCRAAGFEPDVRFESSDLVIHARLVATGHAVAFLPQLMCEDIAEPVRLNRLPPDQARTIFTAVRRGAEDRPDLIAFREALATSYENRN